MVKSVGVKLGGAGESPWVPTLPPGAGPLYLAIAEAIAADRAAGILAAGQRLPPQRTLARALGIDFTTVSRAYAEAARRGLVEGRVGQGTFVRADPALPARTRPQAARSAAPPRPVAAPSGLADLSMNLPPRFDDEALTARLWDSVASLRDGGLDLLLRYQEPGGTAADRAAGAGWLAPRLPGLEGPGRESERLLVCPGAQGALLAIAGLLAAPGDLVCVEALTYPGFRALAAQLRLRLAPLAFDREGLDPYAFEAQCRRERPKALYCTPTLHNPTTATLPLERRRALVAIARRHGVPIVEDDAYGALPAKPLPPLAALAPELVWHVAGLAKCLSPALRIAYVAVPDVRAGLRLGGALRATAAMASPLGAATATRWIGEGLAAEVLAAIRAECAARQALARALLPAEAVAADPEGFHLWLTLPPPWSRGAFAERLRAAGVSAVVSDAFALDRAPEAVRLGLGAAAGRAALERGLGLAAELLAAPPELSSLIV